MTVPGFYAADGNAGRTGADSGNKWRACFSPNEVGTGRGRPSFREGKDVAIATDPQGRQALEATRRPVGHVRGGRVRQDRPRLPQSRQRPDHSIAAITTSRSPAASRFSRAGPACPRTCSATTASTTRRSNNKRGPLYEDIPAEEIYLHRFAGHTQDWQPGDPDWDRNDGPAATRKNAGRNYIGMLNFLGRQHGCLQPLHHDDERGG